MGAADVIPGVSGGTIAFITGIYDELVNSIRRFDWTALKMLGRLDFGGFWRHVNGNFLLCVVGGIGLAVFTLAKLMTWLLESYPIPTWSFFFGLIVASALWLSRDLKRGAGSTLGLIAGAVAGYLITIATPTHTPDTWWFIVLSGAIAICAMILPGISGAFILLLLGKYEFILLAVSELDLHILILFAVGAIAGIISFSHLLSWLLSRHRNVTLALLIGFMIGSLNKVWPWKQLALKEGVMREISVMPGRFERTMGMESHVWMALLFMVVGFALIFVIENLGKRISK